MGFETFNPILNLGGIFIVILITIAQFILLLILKLVARILKKKLIAASQLEGGTDETDLEN